MITSLHTRTIRAAAALAAGAMLFVPLAAGAVTASELRTQIASLQAQLQQLQDQLSQLEANGGGSSSGLGNVSVCPSLTRTLSIGISGNDVSSLQQYLTQTGDYTYGQVTGYYGPVTEAAVQRWQSRNGVVSYGTPSTTGYGLVGPQTRAAIMATCAGGSSSGSGTTSQTGAVGGTLNVTPTYGEAPLAVTFQTTINTTLVCNAPSYQLNFGDGTGAVNIAVPSGSCSRYQQSFTHTYQNPGTYTVTLGANGHQTTSTITVTPASNTNADGSNSSGNGNTSYSTSFSVDAGASGNPKQLQVNFQVQGSSCTSYVLDWGDGTTPVSAEGTNYNVCTQDVANKQFQHTYQNAGFYTITLKLGHAPISQLSTVATANVSITQ